MLSVAVTGNNLDRVTYQWYHMETLEGEEDGETYTYRDYVLLPDETGSQLETVGITERNQYYCKVQDGFGNEKEVLFVVLPDNSLEVEAVGDTDISVSPNQSATLAVSVQAADTTDMKLEWLGYQSVERTTEGGSTYIEKEWGVLAEGTDTFTTPELTEDQDFVFRATDRYGTILEVRFYVCVNNHFTLSAVGDTDIKVLANEWTELQVEAGGEDLSNVTYQWYHVVTNEYEDEDGELYTDTFYYPMDGQTGSSCSVMASAGREQYACKAWDGYGQQEEVQFWVCLENHFAAWAKDYDTEFHVPYDNCVNMQVEVTCDDPSSVTYTWYRVTCELRENSEGQFYANYSVNRNEPLEETGSTLTSAPVEYRTAYSCVVEDGYGNSEEIWFYLFVDNDFYLTSGDGTDTYYIPFGETTTLHTGVHGKNLDQVRYQWGCLHVDPSTDDDGQPYLYRHWEAIPDEYDSSLVTYPTTMSGEYSCEAADIYGNTYTEWFYTYVQNDFTAQSAGGNDSIYVNPGDPVTLQVEASALDMDGITYEWYKAVRDTTVAPDGAISTSEWYEEVAGASGSSLKLDSVDTSGQYYYCTVTDKYDSSINVPFWVYVDNPFTVKSADGNNDYRIAPGESKELQVTVSGDEIYDATYQWYCEDYTIEYDNGEPCWNWKTHLIYGATQSSYTAGPVDHKTEFYCRVTDRYGNYKDCSFNLIVDNGFSVDSVGDRSVYVNAGDTAVLQVNASANDTTGMTYQWYCNTREPFVNEYGYNDYTWRTDCLVGETSDRLVTEPVSDYCEYYCHVQDAYGNYDNIWYDIHVDNQLDVSDSCTYNVAPGDAKTLHVDVSAKDMSNLDYRWYRVESFTEINEDGDPEIYSRDVPVGDNSDTYVTDSLTSKSTYICYVEDQYGNTARVHFYIYIDNDFYACALDENNDFYVAPGETQQLEVVAQANVTDRMTYQWYHLEQVEYHEDNNSWTEDNWVAVEGANQNVLTTDAIQNREQYYCRVEDGFGNWDMVHFWIHVENHFSADGLGGYPRSVAPGESVTLEVDAHADQGPLTYQWYWQEPIKHVEEDGSTWTERTEKKLDGETGPVIQTFPLTSEWEDYYCRVSDPYGNSTSVWFCLQMDNRLEANPANGENTVFIKLGETALLEVEATAANTDYMTYQWQVVEEVEYTDEESGETRTEMRLVPIEGETGPTFRTPAVTYYKDYACRVEDGYGGFRNVWMNVRVDSGFQVEHVGEELIPVNVGDNVTLQVNATANDSPLTYHWEAWGCTSFANGADDGRWYAMENATGDTLNLYIGDEIIYNMAFCNISDDYGNKETVWFYLEADNHLSVEPVSESPMYVPRGEPATLMANVTATDTSYMDYQWYQEKLVTYSYPDATWSQLERIPIEDVKAPMLDIDAVTEQSTYVLVVTDRFDHQQEVCFEVTPARITQQPADVSGNPGETVNTSVAVESMEDSLHYQWQMSDGESWADIEGQNEPTCSLTLIPEMHAHELRCIITNEEADLWLYSEPATISVNLDGFCIAQQPESVTSLVGEDATFRVTAEGENLTYQWQYQAPGGSWKETTLSGNKTDTLTVSATAGRNGYQYRCVVSNGALQLESDAAKLTVFGITTQPESVSAKVGQITTMKVVAVGTDLTYQWQYQKADGTWANTTLTGCKTDTLKINATLARDGNVYRCVVKCGDLKVESEGAALSVFGIKTQPASVSAAAGETVTMQVAATGTDLTYQWQYQKADGSWNNTTLTGCKTDTLTIPATMGRSGNIYRCVVKCGEDTLYSDGATLTVFGIKTQPASICAGLGNTVKMQVVAAGENLTYQWQYLKADGTWANTTLTGCKTDTLSIVATAARNGNQYRCVVKSGDLSFESDAATLTVFTITAQPENASGVPGGSVTFKVTATGEKLTYQWQYQAPGGSWKNTTLSGNKTALLTVPITAGRNDYKYRCVVKSGDQTLNSNAAVLNVLSIKTQPADVSAGLGAIADISVVATGENLTYQWQYQAPGGSWKNTTLSGNKTDTLHVTATAGRDGYQYRCVVKMGDLTVESDGAKLTVIPIQITAQPEDFTGAAGDTATFTVKASGNDLTYQWQYSENGGTTWKDSTNKTAVAAVGITAKRDGRLYRCVITDADGNQLISDTALLTWVPVKITVQPVDYSGDVGDSAVFAVAAQGDMLSYQWQYSDNAGKSWNNSSSKEFSAACKITEARDGRLYRCIVTDGTGYSVTSDPAKIILTHSDIQITQQPVNYTGAVGENATFHVTASGNGLKYQWKFTDDGVNWKTSSSKSDTAICEITAARDGRLYRCIITDANGSTRTTAIAKIIVG